MTENTTPATATVIEFPKKSIAQKATKYVIATGLIAGGSLAWFNYKAKRDSGELDLQSDSEELDNVEG